MAADKVQLSGSIFADANLARLIAVRDADRANRDWAVMPLSEQDLDTPDIITALRKAADDDDAYVRAEAIFGLAGRDPGGTLSLVLRELKSGHAAVAVLEAATVLADLSLADALRAYAEPSDDPRLDGLVIDAIAACAAGPTP